MIGRFGRVLAALVVGLAALAVASAPAHAREEKSMFEFRAVLAEIPPAGVSTTTLAPRDRVDAAATVASCDVAAVSQLPVVPTTRSVVARADACVVFPLRPRGASSPRYYLGPAALSNRAVKSANAEFRSGQGWTVTLALTNAGSRAWDQLAEQQFHEQVAITLGGAVLAAPTIQPNDASFTSFAGVAVVSGAFTQKQARAIATAVRAPNRG